MARFNGTPVQQQRKPRFGGVPVGTPSAMPHAQTGAPDPALATPGSVMQPPAPAPEPSLIDRIMSGAAATGSVAQQGVHGVANGIELILGALGDVSPDSMPLFGTLPGRADIHQLSTLFGALPERSEPEGFIETLVNRVGEEVGASLIPAGGIAARAVQKGLPAIREAGGLARYFMEPAAVNPAAFMGKETAVASAAGTGAGIVNNVIDRDTPAGQWADMAGALTGAGIYGLGGAILPRLGDLVAAGSGNPRYASQVVRQNAADTIISNSDNLGAQVDPARPHDPVDTTSLIDQIMAPSQAEAVIPSFQASIADRSGDFGLASLENARSKGPNAGRFRARQDANTDAVDARLGELAPTEQPGAFRTALDDERERQLREAIMGRDEAAGVADAAVAPLVPQTTPAVRGNVVRTGLEDARGVARERTEDAYNAADVADVPVDPAGLAATIDEATAGLTAVERGLIPEGMLDRVRALGQVGEEGAAPEPVRMREASTLLSELKRLQRAAQADPRAERGGRNASRVLNRIVEAVDGFIMSNLDEGQQEALQTARSTKFDEAESFTRAGDPVAAALARHEGGHPRMRDDRVAGTFINPENMDRLFAQADTPATRAAIREELLSRADTTNADQIDTFMATYGEQMDRFPGLREQLTDAATARRTQAGATEAEAATRRRLGTPDGSTPGRSRVASYLRFGDERAETAMRNVINDPQPAEAVDELLTFVNDEPRAVEGARRAFWDVMERDNRSQNGAHESATGTMPWLTRKWRTFLDLPKVRAVTERLYRDAPEHLAQIREIAEALRTVNTGTKAGMAINPSGSAQQLRNGPVTLAEAQAKFIDVQRGRLNPLYAITYLAGKVANRLVSKQAERAYQMLLDEALLNPEVAAELLRQNNPANRAALARKAKGWLGAEAAHLVDALDGEDDGPVEIIDQVMSAGEQRSGVGGGGEDDEIISRVMENTAS